MKKNLFLILLLEVFLIAGSATAGQAKDDASAKVIYTDAPIGIAFDASRSALKNLGYKIEKEDAGNFSVQGSCINLLTGHTPFYAHINLTQEAEGVKITCSVKRPGAIKVLDVTGYYSPDNIYREIVKILAQDETAYRKVNKENRKKKDHKSPEED